MERQRNKCLEAASLVLHPTQFEQVVHAIFVVFNVPVEHGRVRLQPYLVRQLGRIQPLRAVDLVIADDVANAVGEYLSATARQRIYSSFLQLQQRVADAQLRNLRQERDFHHRESFKVYLRKPLLQAGTQVQEVLEWQVGVQAADNVELRDALGIPGGCGVKSFF